KNIPVRIKSGLNKDEILNISDDKQKLIKMFDSLDQLSGLALRKNFLNLKFHSDIFTAHVYPWVDIFKNHPIMFLKNNTVAVRIQSSQSRSVSSIYNKSPIQSWQEMFINIFDKSEFSKDMIKNFVAKNYIGLVQIKNYASSIKYLWREIWLLIKYRPQNLYNLKFWFFSLGCLILPRKILQPLVDWYKNKINARFISGCHSEE
ncbi:hypothetical protein ACFL1Y_01360, partial [Patescibacteria group bacterium]